MISIIFTIILSLASKVFGALLIIIRLFIKLLIILIKALINLIKNLIERLRNRGGTKCQKN
jgi:hypothetical protein